MSETADVAIPENATDERTYLDVMGYDPDMDFRKLALEAQYRSKGFRLVEKAQLIGVPHVIVGVTYREGYVRDGRAGDYVSLEAVVADAQTLASPPVESMLPDTLTVFGNEPVVYNDGSKGIRRAMTEMLHIAGVIDVGEPNDKDQDENRYDRAYQFWTDGEDIATKGIVADVNGQKLRYLAFRGLRRSDYESPFGPATTYYFG